MAFVILTPILSSEDRISGGLRVLAHLKRGVLLVGIRNGRRLEIQGLHTLVNERRLHAGEYRYRAKMGKPVTIPNLINPPHPNQVTTSRIPLFTLLFPQLQLPSLSFSPSSFPFLKFPASPSPSSYSDP